MVGVIRPTTSYYSPQQLTAYLRRVGLGSIRREPSLETLNLMVRHHLLRIPYENTQFHYRPSRKADVSPPAVFDRCVVSARGGGDCLQQLTLMLGMLRAMGFGAYPTAGRPYLPDPDTGEFAAVELCHMSLLVQVPASPEETYFVEVGLPSVTRPILLKHNQEAIGAALPEKARIVKRPYEHSVLVESDGPGGGGGDDWCLQSNYLYAATEGQWCDVLSFSTKEYFQQDVEMLWCAASQRVAFTLDNVVAFVFKPLDDGEEDDDADPMAMGRLFLAGNLVTYKAKGAVKVFKEMKSERDRIEALREYFGIQIEDGADTYLSSAARLWQKEPQVNGTTLPLPEVKGRL